MRFTQERYIKEMASIMEKVERNEINLESYGFDLKNTKGNFYNLFKRNIVLTYTAQIQHLISNPGAFEAFGTFTEEDFKSQVQEILEETLEFV